MLSLLRSVAVTVLTISLVACGGGGASEDEPQAIDLGNVAYWTFDNISAGKAENIKFAGWPVVFSGVSVVSGKYGSAVSFDPDVRSCAHIARQADIEISFPENKVSFAAWINPREIAADSEYQILGDQRFGVKSFSVRLTNGKIRVFAGEFSSVDLITSTQSISTNTWTHVAVSYDGNTARVFINGLLDSTRSILLQIPSVVNDLYLGCLQDASTADAFGGGMLIFPGAIDELYVAADELTPAQLSNLVAGIRP
jgi:hypothetical protein